MTMSDWMRTKVGFQMAETITRQLPRIAKSLEDISKGNTISKNNLVYLDNGQVDFKERKKS